MEGRLFLHRNGNSTGSSNHAVFWGATCQNKASPDENLKWLRGPQFTFLWSSAYLP
ncbi:unnamed protein product, partial [Gulo gulo]